MAVALLDALVPRGLGLTEQPHVRHCWSRGKEEKMVEHHGSLSFCSEAGIDMCHMSVLLAFHWLKQTVWPGLMSVGWEVSPTPSTVGGGPVTVLSNAVYHML